MQNVRQSHERPHGKAFLRRLVQQINHQRAGAVRPVPFILGSGYDQGTTYLVYCVLLKKHVYHLSVECDTQ